MLKRLFGRAKKANGPMERFEREISTWPDDSARTALLLLKATLKGNQAGIDRHYQELTIVQLKFVRKTLEEMEAEQSDQHSVVVLEVLSAL